MGMGDKDRDCSRLQSVLAVCPESPNVKFQAGLEYTFGGICSWWDISYPQPPIAKIWAPYAVPGDLALKGQSLASYHIIPAVQSDRGGRDINRTEAITFLVVSSLPAPSVMTQPPQVN